MIKSGVPPQFISRLLTVKVENYVCFTNECMADPDLPKEGVGTEVNRSEQAEEKAQIRGKNFISTRLTFNTGRGVGRVTGVEFPRQRLLDAPLIIS